MSKADATVLLELWADGTYRVTGQCDMAVLDAAVAGVSTGLHSTLKEGGMTPRATEATA